MTFAGAARTRAGEELNLVDRDRFELCWIVDFPFFEWNEEEKKIDFGHNPFSMPQGGIEALTDKEPLSIKAFQYDMVCNGFEIASGGIRNHLPETMVKAFEIVGFSRETVEERFGGLYRAFQYGAPPHGGMAAGIDRVVMLLVGAKNLREVTMFPMNQQAYDLLMNAPAPADADAVARASPARRVAEEHEPDLAAGERLERVRACDAPSKKWPRQRCRALPRSFDVRPGPAYFWLAVT